MKQQTEGTFNNIIHWNNFKLKLVGEGLLVGIITGFIIVLYRVALDKAAIILNYMINLQNRNYIWFIPMFLFLLISAIITDALVNKEPLISGSGIPQVEGYLLYFLEMRWLKVLIYKFVGGIISIGSGLSLGREGPSIQLGASIGKGVSDLFKREKAEERFLITGGASAGLAAAFNAPLAGVIFALEELHKNFSPLVIITALSATMTADFVCENFVGMKPIFDFSQLNPIPLRGYPFVIVLGIIIGLAGVLYNKVLLKFQEYFQKRTYIDSKYKIFIPFILAGIFSLILPEVLGGGHPLIEKLSSNIFSIKVLVLIIIVKFFYTMICYGSGAPGGIFLPLLVIGALIGNLYGNVLHNLIGFNQDYINNLMILAMAGYFTAIVRAPITGSVLLCEMAGSFSHFLPLIVISLTTYIITDILKCEPIYESLLFKLINSGKNNYKVNNSVKVIIEQPVCICSYLEGKQIKEIKWPDNCWVAAIKRGSKDIIPQGDTIICSGDYLIIMTLEDYVTCVKEKVIEMAEGILINTEG